MSPHIHIYPNNTEWEIAVTEALVRQIHETITKKGRCTISLAGGSTPKSIYALLAVPTYASKINWDKVFFFWGDERCVPHDHPDSNYKMVKEALLDHVPVSKDQIFPVPNPTDPAKAAKAYEENILTFFGDENPMIDIMLLGMGDDGHTASLFPNTDILNEKEALIKEVFLPTVQVYRISMTVPFINASATIFFLIKGANKAPALNQVLTGANNFELYPSQLIKKDNTVHFYLDSAAAKNL